MINFTIFKKPQNVTLLLLAVLLIFFSGCSSRSKIAKTGTPQEKFDLAKSYYNKEAYHRALPIFQELLGVFRESNRLEEVYYYLSYSLYGMGEFMAAAKHFYTFTETFINSSKTEECFFMYCKCQFYATDPFYLDQSLSKKAIENFQLFTNLFPGSVYQDEANNYIDQLRRKLKDKAYHTAMLYFRMQDYKAAIVTFTYCIQKYPDIEEKEEIEYFIFKSAVKYAELSVENKQLERYKEALFYYREYMDANSFGAKHYEDVQALKLKIDIQIMNMEEEVSDVRTF